MIQPTTHGHPECPTCGAREWEAVCDVMGVASYPVPLAGPYELSGPATSDLEITQLLSVSCGVCGYDAGYTEDGDGGLRIYIEEEEPEQYNTPDSYYGGN